MNNHYPPDFLNKYINIRLNTPVRQSEKLAVDSVKHINICIPYINQVSQKIKKSFQKFSIKTVFKNQRKNKCSFDKLKDRDKINLRSNMIYEIP